MDYLEQIRTARECKDFSQEFMAEKLGITVGAYGKLERGESRMSVDTLIEIAKILEIALSDLFLIKGKAPVFSMNNSLNNSPIHLPHSPNSAVQQHHSNYYYIVGDEAIEKLSLEVKHLNDLLDEKIEQIENLKEIISLMKKAD